MPSILPRLFGTGRRRPEQQPGIARHRPGVQVTARAGNTDTIIAFVAATHPLVLRERGSKTRFKLEKLAADLRVDLEPSIEAEGREAVREIVASGVGVGFVSRAEFGSDARLHPIEIDTPPVLMDEALICLGERLRQTGEGLIRSRARPRAGLAEPRSPGRGKQVAILPDGQIRG